MADLIEVVNYKDEWRRMFESEAALIKQALGENCLVVHHIGSTAVPGLVAKPVIDILPVVKNIQQVDRAEAAMKKLGYEFKGEYGIPFRRYFQKGGDYRTHHVHVFEEGDSEIERHIKFRDWMRSHSDDREAYGALKMELASKYSNDRMAYCIGKDAFIADIDNKAGFHGFRMVKALTNSEWDTVRRLRQKYFFDRVPVNDPYTWTFDDPKHVHFVLYQGMNHIGYAHIQLWPEQRAAMRIIVIDEPYRHQGAGGELLKRCERWLSHQNIKQLLVQSSPDAYPFYCKHAYVKMPFNDPDGYESDPRDIEIGKVLSV